MIFTAQLRARAAPAQTCLIADRWRWAAFAAPLLWALWNGHFVLAAALFLGLAGLADLAMVQPGAALAFGLGARLIMGWEAGALARLDRRLRGWRERGAVEARRLDEAELLWFGGAS